MPGSLAAKLQLLADETHLLRDTGLLGFSLVYPFVTLP